MSSSELFGPVEKVSLKDTSKRVRLLLVSCQDHLPDEEPRRLAEAQLAHFNTWASTIGVFSGGHASLDYRLQTAPAFKASVAVVLYTICESLLAGKLA